MATRSDPPQLPDSYAFSVIIPAHNEEDYIAPCLDALLAQQNLQAPIEVLLMANACIDATVTRALPYKSRFANMGSKLRILRVKTPGKVHALNCADRAASGAKLIYLDADVICGPKMLALLNAALAPNMPLYASGKLNIAPAKTWISRAYGRTWAALPFMKSPAIGAGLFAVNRAGRRRWDDFPDIISDDTFVRLQFTPEERIEVAETFQWPLVEGFGNLVRVRRRQDAGVTEIASLYPDLMSREAKPDISFAALFLRDPISFLCYASVKLAVKLRKQDKTWSRGR